MSARRWEACSRPATTAAGRAAQRKKYEVTEIKGTGETDLGVTGEARGQVVERSQQTPRHGVAAVAKNNSDERASMKQGTRKKRKLLRREMDAEPAETAGKKDQCKRRAWLCRRHRARPGPPRSPDSCPKPATNARNEFTNLMRQNEERQFTVIWTATGFSHLNNSVCQTQALNAHARQNYAVELAADQNRGV